MLRSLSSACASSACGRSLTRCVGSLLPRVAAISALRTPLSAPAVPCRSFAAGKKAAKLAAKPITKPAPVDVAGVIAANIKHLTYTGDASFLAPATEKTKKVWSKCVELLAAESKKNGVLDVDPVTVSSITSHAAGYIDRENEVIVGLQTDAPLKRGIKPYGGLRMVKDALEAYGYPVDPRVNDIFTNFRKTHNAGVFDVYTPEMKLCRTVHILTGLPDAYGRGRIIGDYRRVAVYGVDHLIAAKQYEHDHMGPAMVEDSIRLTEEIAEQIRALKDLKRLGAQYGFDISKPAATAREAVQWTYFAYLAAVKEQDGAAMSMGRIDTVLDYFIERDIKAGRLDEAGAQELIDQLVIKLRLVRHLRPPAYNELFAGDPVWVTCVLGGMLCNKDGSAIPLVTKTSFRMLHTLINLGPAPEPNLTVLWDERLPENFKRFCASISCKTSSIQYESDTLMGPRFGSDYSIACCVSAMNSGKDMQFFGARCNLGKLLLYALNNGFDEIAGVQVGNPKFFAPLTTTTANKGGQDEQPLVFEEVKERFDRAMDWLAGVYVNTMNVIHYMHDKYCYERLQMALHDTQVRRLLAFGIAGLSVLADSLSAIKHAKVYPIRNEQGLTVDFKVEGEFPKYGNDIDAVDMEAKWAVEQFYKKLASHKTYRNSVATLSVLTITSNVVYGKNTGTTPDGRKKGEPFAPGANPMHGRDTNGCLASLNTVAKLPYDSCRDGISNTFCIVPHTLGKSETERSINLANVLDGYFKSQGFHLNVNVFDREMLEDARKHPEKYPQLTIRVSGYAVNFSKLTPEQQKEVIARTFHDSM